MYTPILKKRCLDHNDVDNYQPVSNLCLIAKMLERLFLSKASSYLDSHNLYNTYQSAYCLGHSTETALLIVVNDLFISLGKGSISALALLNVSSAFDPIDHSILVHRLHSDFGFTDLQWFSSYLTDRTHYVTLLIIVLLLLLYTQLFLRVKFLALCFSPCMKIICLPLLTHTISYISHLLMTYNHRCQLPLMEYLSYFTLDSHV